MKWMEVGKRVYLLRSNVNKMLFNEQNNFVVELELGADVVSDQISGAYILKYATTLPQDNS